jgi:hypothetical protein
MRWAAPRRSCLPAQSGPGNDIRLAAPVANRASASGRARHRSGRARPDQGVCGHPGSRRSGQSGQHRPAAAPRSSGFFGLSRQPPRAAESAWEMGTACPSRLDSSISYKPKWERRAHFACEHRLTPGRSATASRLMRAQRGQPAKRVLRQPNNEVWHTTCRLGDPPADALERPAPVFPWR